jgi:hypothetical protein
MLKDTVKRIELHPMTDAERDELDNMTPRRALEFVKFCLRDNPGLRNMQIRSGKATLTLGEIVRAGLDYK